MGYGVEYFCNANGRNMGAKGIGSGEDTERTILVLFLR